MKLRDLRKQTKSMSKFAVKFNSHMWFGPAGQRARQQDLAAWLIKKCILPDSLIKNLGMFSKINRTCNFEIVNKGS